MVFQCYHWLSYVKPFLWRVIISAVFRNSLVTNAQFLMFPGFSLLLSSVSSCPGTRFLPKIPSFLQQAAFHFCFPFMLLLLPPPPSSLLQSSHQALQLGTLKHSKALNDIMREVVHLGILMLISELLPSPSPMSDNLFFNQFLPTKC